jgi:hypothetical protein
MRASAADSVWGSCRARDRPAPVRKLHVRVHSSPHGGGCCSTRSRGSRRCATRSPIVREDAELASRALADSSHDRRLRSHITARRPRRWKSLRRSSNSKGSGAFRSATFQTDHARAVGLPWPQQAAATSVSQPRHGSGSPLPRSGRGRLHRLQRRSVMASHSSHGQPGRPWATRRRRVRRRRAPARARRPGSKRGACQRRDGWDGPAGELPPSSSGCAPPP